MSTEGSSPIQQDPAAAGNILSPAYPQYYDPNGKEIPDVALLKGQALRDFMVNLAENRALPPQAIEQFLAIQYTGDRKAEDLSNKVVTGAGLVAIGGLTAAMFMHLAPSVAEWLRTALPNIGPELHEALQQFHDESFNVSATAAWIDHFLALLQDAGFFGLIGGSFIPGIERRRQKAKIPGAQQALRNRISAQSKEGGIDRQKFHMRDGHTAIIGASSESAPDPLALLFASECEHGDVMMYASQKPPGSDIWTLLQSDSETGNVTTQELDEALLAGGALNAGEYFILPTKGDQYFLPGRKDYDLSPRVVRAIVENIRGFEKRHNIPSRKIIIVGDELQEDVSETILPDGTTLPDRTNRERIDTIRQVVKDAGEIEIISPTTLVLNEMLGRYQDASCFTFHGSEEARAKYSKDFYIRLGRLTFNDPNLSEDEILSRYQDKIRNALTDQGKIVEIGYEIVDTRVLPEVKSKVNDPLFVAVVLTQEVYDECIESGLPEDRIIFVPRLVLNQMKKLAEVHESPPTQTDLQEN